MGIGYPGVSGKATAFTYDGLSRRTAITSTPAGGGSSVTTAYLWCGSALCQARNTSNATTREYLAEGEYVPGTTPQPYYYGPDQIGSVRRVFASTSSAPAFSYDPYGVPLQTTTPVTDFNYAGIFFNADSGLDLTQYRAYDPVAGRWLSRDPIGEESNPVGNLYSYVNNDALNNTDPLGLYTLQLGIAGGGTIFGFVVPQGGFGIAIDTHGNVGTYTYSGIGVGVGVQAEVGGSAQVSTAETIYDLSGPFSNTSAHGGNGLGGSVDYFTGSSSNGQVTGGGITFGLSAGASASLTTTGTQICGSRGCVGSPLPLFNITTPAAAATGEQTPCE